VLVGYLSQYFCEKNSLEEELSLLRRTNGTNNIDLVEDNIKVATRNAYLYATGITSISFTLSIIHAWGFFLGGETGMKSRILLTAAIYEKVAMLIIMCNLCTHHTGDHGVSCPKLSSHNHTY